MKKFDYLIILVALVAAFVVVFTITGKNKSFSNTPVEAVKTISFDATLKGVTITENTPIFVKDAKTFLTIRNVPYKELSITNVDQSRKKIVLPAANTKEKFIVVDDASTPFQYDFVVTLEDTAKITDDGPVVGGNKIKIGIPVVLESKDYKLSGVITSLKIKDDIEQ